jgi:hypothetical protein
MKTPTILTGALTAGLMLIGSSVTASAQPRSAICQAVDNIERSTDHLFTHYKKELQARGLWKPRGAYSKLYSATFRMEEYGDAMKKYHGKHASLATLSRVAANIDRQLATADHFVPHLCLSQTVHENIATVSRAVRTINGLCGGHGRENYHSDHRSSFGNDRDYRDNRNYRSYPNKRRYRDDRLYRDQRNCQSPERNHRPSGSSDCARNEILGQIWRRF